MDQTNNKGVNGHSITMYGHIVLESDAAFKDVQLHTNDITESFASSSTLLSVNSIWGQSFFFYH